MVEQEPPGAAISAHAWRQLKPRPPHPTHADPGAAAAGGGRRCAALVHDQPTLLVQASSRGLPACLPAACVCRVLGRMCRHRLVHLTLGAMPGLGVAWACHQQHCCVAAAPYLPPSRKLWDMVALVNIWCLLVAVPLEIGEWWGGGHGASPVALGGCAAPWAPLSSHVRQHSRHGQQRRR